MPLTRQDYDADIGKTQGQKLAKASQRICAKQSRSMCKRTPIYFPSSRREGSMEREGPGRPLTKEAGELEAADQLIVDTGAP